MTPREFLDKAYTDEWMCPKCGKDHFDENMIADECSYDDPDCEIIKIECECGTKFTMKWNDNDPFAGWEQIVDFFIDDKQEDVFKPAASPTSGEGENE